MKRTRTGVRRWVPMPGVDGLAARLFDKLFKTWRDLAEGAFLAVFRDGRYKLVASAKKTRVAQMNETRELLGRYAADQECVALIQSPMSRDVLTHFVLHVLASQPKGVIESLLRHRRPFDLLVAHRSKFFRRYVDTPKDLTFKGRDTLDAAKVAKKML